MAVPLPAPSNVRALLVAMIFCSLLGCGSTKISEKDLQEIVYVDRQSGKAYLMKAKQSVEVNPETGEATLIPGMYCDQCKAWKPVAPLDQMQSSRLSKKCPIHKTVLLPDGPMPEKLSK